MGLALLAGIAGLHSHPPLAIGIVLIGCWPLLVFFQLSDKETSSPITSIRQTPQGWRLRLASGDVVLAAVHGPVRITPWFVALCWREQSEFARETADATRRAKRSWRVVIWADQLSADDWRRFSVSLRWRRREGSSGDKILSMSSELGSG